MKEMYKINFAAPNLVNVCIDSQGEGGCEGRLYCGYYPEPVHFHGEYGMIKIMEELMDQIGYPQPSTIMRRYNGENTFRKYDVGRFFSGQEIMKEKGRIATLVIYVQYRQNSTWQGEFFWAEKDQVQRFRSVLELLKFMDRISQYGQLTLPECKTTDYAYKKPKDKGGVEA